jgi:hypothetical protein
MSPFLSRIVDICGQARRSIDFKFLLQLDLMDLPWWLYFQIPLNLPGISPKNNFLELLDIGNPDKFYTRLPCESIFI